MTHCLRNFLLLASAETDYVKILSTPHYILLANIFYIFFFFFMVRGLANYGIGGNIPSKSTIINSKMSLIMMLLLLEMLIAIQAPMPNIHLLLLNKHKMLRITNKL